MDGFFDDEDLYCRIGSLETIGRQALAFIALYCRIGSLERPVEEFYVNSERYCRIGSLENGLCGRLLKAILYCRIGSLENRGGPANQDIRLSENSASMGDGNRLPRSRSNEKTPP